MVEIFWNVGEGETIEGLDVLGIRKFDQNLEREWVAGITTISYRGRYLSMLPWLLEEYFEEALRKGQGSAPYDKEQEQRLEATLRRFELIVFLSTRQGATWGESGNTYGVLGSDLYSGVADKLIETGRVDSAVEKGGASLGTYLMPCRSLGLLASPPPGSALPYAISPRGKELFQARHAALAGSPLRQVIIEGGPLNLDDLEQGGGYFSVNGIQSIPREADLLRRALLEPCEGLDEDAFKRFQETLSWALAKLDLLGEAGSDQLILGCYAKVVRSRGDGCSDVELAWFEYDLRRRVHFALELLLRAFTTTLLGRVRADIGRVWREWENDRVLAALVTKSFGWDELPIQQTTAALVKELASETFLDAGVPYESSRKLAPHDMAAFAIGLLLTCLRQSRPLRERGLAGPASALERAADIVAHNTAESFGTLARALVRDCVVGQHLHNALRKMAARGKCTLRFYPDGELLCTTGLGVRAGRSGERLGNVLSILADAGFVERKANTTFRLAVPGRALLAARGVLL